MIFKEIRVFHMFARADQCNGRRIALLNFPCAHHLGSSSSSAFLDVQNFVLMNSIFWKKKDTEEKRDRTKSHWNNFFMVDRANVYRHWYSEFYMYIFSLSLQPARVRTARNIIITFSLSLRKGMCMHTHELEIKMCAKCVCLFYFFANKLPLWASSAISFIFSLL